MQQGDVLFQQTNDGGEIDFKNDLVVFSGGLETAAYLSMFGGNEQDDGSQNTPLQWWGNALDTDDARIVRSFTAYLLRSIAPVPFNLRRIEDAVRSDLGWLIDTGAASELQVTARLIRRETVEIQIGVLAVGLESSFTFIENWKASE